MPITTKIQPIDKDIQLVLNEELSKAAQNAIFQQYARDQIEKVKLANAKAMGRVPKYTVSVDGRFGASITTAKVPGTIVAEFEITTEALLWIAQQIEIHSPLKSGRFRNSSVLLADGALISAWGDIPDAEEYVFINSQPYARKIEAGKSSQAPDGVYQAVATLAHGRFGANVAKITFGYRPLISGAVHDWAGTKSAAAHAGRYKKRGVGAQEWLRRQPAVIVRTHH